MPLVRVASGPTTGQYSVAAGVYTFAAADTTLGVLISYNYTVSGTGQSVIVTNPDLGYTIPFSVNLTGYDPTNGNTFSLQIYKAICGSLSMGTKLEDFMMPEFEAECFVNDAGLLGRWNLPDLA